MSRLRSGNVPEPMDLDEARLGDERQRRGDRRIEPFGVSRRQQRAARCGRVDQPIGVGHARRRSASRPASRRRARGTAARRRRARRSARRSSRHRPRPSSSRDVREHRRAVLRRRSRRRGPAWCRTTPTSSTPCIDGQQPRVVLAQMADADDGDAQAAHQRRRRRSVAACGPPDDGDAGFVRRTRTLRRRRSSASCRHRPTTPWPPRRASPGSSRPRSPARRSACPASASPP